MIEALAKLFLVGALFGVCSGQCGLCVLLIRMGCPSLLMFTGIESGYANDSTAYSEAAQGAG